MAQGMAEQQELLTRLVEEAYAGRKVVLQPISPYVLEDRGIYRVDWGNGTFSVLRAFRADVAVELTGHAAVLDYLQQRGFAAPQVKRTSDGALLACYQGWTMLLLSFLEGEVADFALHSLNLLSACAGRLHTFSHDVLAVTESVCLPDSPLRPTQPASLAIDNLIQALPHVPEALHQFCEDCIVSLQHMQQCDLQTTLAKSGGISFTSASARIASRTLFESSFRLRPRLHLPEGASGGRTADESCPSRPGGFVGKAGRTAATSWFTEPF